MMKLLAAVLAGWVFAAGAVDMKIGFVNTERVFREAGPAPRAPQELDRGVGARQPALAQLEKQGGAHDNHLQREIREDLNLRRNEELASVQERATRVINQIAEQEKFDLIIQEAVFASGKIDITEKVIRALADK
jgi:outer membrane protein